MTKSKSVRIKTESGYVSGIFQTTKTAKAGLTLAHGAGAGMDHPFLRDLSAALVAHGFAVLRFQFPYMEAGNKRPDSPKVATATVAAAVAALRKRVPDLPLFGAGKSFGSRMTTTAASEGLLKDLSGIICFGFPLHPAGQPGIKRAEHLSRVAVKMLFLQGTRDDLADLKLMRGVCKKRPLTRLHVVDGADHGFGVLIRSGRTSTEVMQELASEAADFARPFLSRKSGASKTTR